MAVTCPICNKGTIQQNGDKTIFHCSLQKTEKIGGQYEETGECRFKIFANQTKYFGKVLTSNDIKAMVEGKGVKNAKGDTMYLDAEAGAETGYFTRVEYAEKKPSKDI
ncbi:hypothetical protein ACMTF7_001080 [Campylobacter jejuni]|uniref:hypothetical protein n=1 Tax=Campylobacter jejuni TaxID=197 RepID=UPI0008745323|nr:hypothetical protein [Campylobacter jejuni]EEU7469636.1 hypothetical protein [Campylobacter jejuni]MCW1355355.1 hypothetical protein [Campylobacter jejuni]OEV61775.1 hypothetical protein AJY73_10495 [Campylobacter jejuni]HEG2941919.1 hypothetical protein [Campylobacter jejuni]